MSPYDNEVHASDYIAILKKRKAIIVNFFLITVLLTTLLSILMPPVYRATVTLMVDLESPNMLTTTGSVALGNVNYYAYKEYFQSQKAIIRSRAIAHQIFEEFNLAQYEDYQKSKDTIKTFLKTVKVDPVRDTRLLALHVDNKDPVLARDIANRIAEIFVLRNLEYISKSEVINLHKNEYLRLQRKLSEYSKAYKHKHPKILRLKEEIKQMAGKIQAEKERVQEAVSLTNALLEPGSISVLASLKPNNISIQDRAETPKIPDRPKKRLNIALAIVLGLFGGTGLAFLSDYLDDTLGGSEEVERIVKWPFLGNISMITKVKRPKPANRAIVSYIKPKDPVSESFRTIRTSLLFSSTEERPLNMISITSPGPQEGKTTILCNLAMTLSQINKKVLLVDADMRKSKLHDILKVKSDVGLSSFLTGQSEFKDIVHKTQVENLSLVPAGPHPPNPSELLSSHKLKDFIKLTREKYDFVLFDSPPISLVVDAAILAREIDGIIILLEGNKTHRRMLPKVHHLLKDSKIRIIGFIINKFISHDSEYSYKEYYGKS